MMGQRKGRRHHTNDLRVSSLMGYDLMKSDRQCASPGVALCAGANHD